MGAASGHGEQFQLLHVQHYQAKWFFTASRVWSFEATVSHTVPWLGFDSVGDCKRRRRELGGSTGGPTSQRPKSNDDNDERTHKKTLIPLRKDV